MEGERCEAKEALQDGVAADSTLHSNCTTFHAGSFNASLIEDITVLLETSFVLRSTKYLEKKTCFVFHYAQFTCANALYAFVVTITRRWGGGMYCGYDSSTYLLIRTSENLTAGERYMVYGRIRNARVKVVEAVKIERINYKSLCYHAF